ncbi:Oxidoreductase htatip2 [Dimargaris cristalligena]|nr:Oxidoreductase htatip2 [Dimargaris cristalligena]
MSADPAQSAILAQVSSFQTAYAARSPRAILIGATGEVGKEVLQALLTSGAFEQVTTLARRTIPDERSQATFSADAEARSRAVATRWVQHTMTDFDQLGEPAQLPLFEGHTHAFCCLGTTRAKSGAEGFHKVDHDYVVAFAEQFARANGTSVAPSTGTNTDADGDVTDQPKADNDLYLALVTSLGADRHSRMLYTRTKGEAEHRLKQLGFGRLAIFQPGMLMCEREEARSLERLVHHSVRALSYIMSTKSMAISTALLGRAIVHDALKHPLAGPRAPVTETMTNSAIINSITP